MSSISVFLVDTDKLYETCEVIDKSKEQFSNNPTINSDNSSVGAITSKINELGSEIKKDYETTSKTLRNYTNKVEANENNLKSKAISLLENDSVVKNIPVMVTDSNTGINYNKEIIEKTNEDLKKTNDDIVNQEILKDINIFVQAALLTGEMDLEEYAKKHNIDPKVLKATIESPESIEKINEYSLKFKKLQNEVESKQEYEEKVKDVFTSSMLESLSPFQKITQAATTYKSIKSLVELAGEEISKIKNKKESKTESKNNEKIVEITNKITSMYLNEIGAIGYIYSGAKSLITSEEYNDVLEETKEKTKDIKTKLLEVKKSTNALSADGLISLTQGVLNFGEEGVKTLELLSTADEMVSDGYKSILKIITNKESLKEFEERNTERWNEVGAFVSTEHIESLYDKFYDETDFGKIIKETTPFHKQVREISSGIGYLGASLFTGSLASGAVTEGVALAPKVANIIRSLTNAFVYGSARFGGATGDAINDGATMDEALLYGGATGVKEASGMFIGSAIQGWNPFGSGKPLKTIANSLLHVGLDSVDGAASAAIDPVLQSLYTPSEESLEARGYKLGVDSYKNLSLGEKYVENFNANGGWNNIIGTAVFSGGLSLLSEIPDMTKNIIGYNQGTALYDEIAKTRKGIQNTSNEEELKSLTDKLSNLYKKYGNLGSSSKYYFDLEKIKQEINVGNITPESLIFLLDSNNTKKIFDSLTNDEKLSLLDSISKSEQDKIFESLGKTSTNIFKRKNKEYFSNGDLSDTTAQTSKESTSLFYKIKNFFEEKQTQKDYEKAISLWNKIDKNREMVINGVTDEEFELLSKEYDELQQMCGNLKGNTKYYYYLESMKDGKYSANMKTSITNLGKEFGFDRICDDLTTKEIITNLRSSSSEETEQFMKCISLETRNKLFESISDMLKTQELTINETMDALKILIPSTDTKQFLSEISPEVKSKFTDNICEMLSSDKLHAIQLFKFISNDKCNQIFENTSDITDFFSKEFISSGRADLFKSILEFFEQSNSEERKQFLNLLDDKSFVYVAELGLSKCSKIDSSELDEIIMERFKKFNGLFGISEEIKTLQRRISPDNQKIVFNTVKEKASEILENVGLPKTFIPNILEYNYSEELALEYYSKIVAAQDLGYLTKENVALLSKLFERNPYILTSLDVNILNPEIASIGKKFIDKMIRYPEYAQIVTNMQIKNPDGFKILKILASDLETADDSLTIYNEKLRLLISACNSAPKIALEQPHDYFEYAIGEWFNFGENGTISSSKILFEYTGNYQKTLNEQLDILFKSATTIEEKRNILMKKLFGVNGYVAEYILNAYYNNLSLEDLEKARSLVGDATLDFVNNLYKVSKIEDEAVIEELYNSSIGSRENIIKVYRDLKRVFAQTYNEQLGITADAIEDKLARCTLVKHITDFSFDKLSDSCIVEINGKKVPVVEVPEEFSFMVHSTSAFGSMKVLNDSYCDAWNKSSRTSSHGICCSYITDSMFGIAPIKEGGVLFGFSGFSDDAILKMGPYDLVSTSDELTQSSCFNSLFIPAKSMSSETTYAYSEFLIERTELREEFNNLYNNLQPNYVIVFKEWDNELKQNALKAASDFNPPLKVVYIDSQKVAKTAMEKVDTMIDSFSETHDLSLFKNALDIHESIKSTQNVSFNNFSTSFLKISSSLDNYLTYMKSTYDSTQNSELCIGELERLKEIIQNKQNQFSRRYGSKMGKFSFDAEEITEKIDDVIKYIKGEN